jgi:LysM repeat protein
VRVVTLGSEEFLELETARRGKKRLTYTAKPGDTLAKLGRRYGLTPGDLARINRFSTNTELHEGDRIVVYSPTGDAPRETTMGLTPKKRTDRGVPLPVAKPESPLKRKPAAVPGRVVAGGHTPAPDPKKKPAVALKPGDKTASNAGKKK